MGYKICGKVTRKVFDRNQIWRHNGLMGKVKMAEIAMQEVYDSPTTTEECRTLAAKIEGELAVLFRLIHTRRDQQK